VFAASRHRSPSDRRTEFGALGQGLIQSEQHDTQTQAGEQVADFYYDP